LEKEVVKCFRFGDWGADTHSQLNLVIFPAKGEGKCRAAQALEDVPGGLVDFPKGI